LYIDHLLHWIKWNCEVWNNQSTQSKKIEVDI
jgi:hypothetical protein